MRYHIDILAVELETDEAGLQQFRDALPGCLAQLGATGFKSTRTVEAWLVENTERPPEQKMWVKGASDWLPSAPKHRRMGRGPNA